MNLKLCYGNTDIVHVFASATKIFKACSHMISDNKTHMKNVKISY